MSRPVAPWLLTAALLFPLAACGGSDDVAAASDQAAAGSQDGAGKDAGAGKAGDCKDLYGITFCMAYDLTGEVTAKGTFPGTATDGEGEGPATCAEWAKGATDDDGMLLYMPQGGQYTMQDEFAGLTGNIITDYRGPGTYPKRQLSGGGSPSGIITPSAQYTFVLVEDSTGTATVAADGSGSFTFTDLGTGQYAHDETVSGTVTWTCHD